MIIATHGIIASQLAGFDADAQAFFDRVTTAGGSLSATEKSAVNTLVLDLKGYSIWSKMKAIYPMVGASAAACAQNLKSSSFTGTFNGGWTYASTGVTPNGTNGYMNTGLNAASNLSQNSTHIASYIRTSSQGILLGIDFAHRLWIAPNFNGTAKYVQINNSNAAALTPISNSVGLWLGSRISSTAEKLYYNNTTDTTKSANSTGIDNGNIFISCRNDGGNPASFSSAQCAFASIGDGLSDTEASNFYTAVNSFQVSLSRNV